MDSRFLHSFISVVELGSIAAAARHLQISTAAVAQRIRVLETMLGIRLVVRSGRTVTATATGNRVLRRAHLVLREIRDLKSEASESTLPSGPLRLGTYQSALTGFAPAVLRAWVARYPHIEVYIEPGSSAVLYGRVLSGELDAAFIVHPLFELPKTCGWRLLREEPLVLVTPASMRVEDALATLNREPFIRYDRATVAGKLIDGYLHRHGVQPQVRFELNGIEAIARLVSEGLGVALLPDCPISGGTEEALRRWPLLPPFISRSVGIIWSRSGVRCPLAEAFVEVAARTPLASQQATRRVRKKASKSLR